MLKTMVLLLALALAANAQSYSIRTVAGGVPAAGDSVPKSGPTHARYVVLSEGCQIWVVSTGGTISQVIGNGACGYSGDNGQAAAAQLYFPKSVTVDGIGDLYIAEEGQRVRKVSGGTISSLPAGAGLPQGLAASAAGAIAVDARKRIATGVPLASPGGSAVDSNGNLFIADTAACVVRKVAAATRMLSTVAGTGTCGYNGDGVSATSAQLNRPGTVAVDRTGDLYISDSANQRIRKVSGGTITTVAGTGTAGYNGDNIDAKTAELSDPQGLAVDGSGNLYIAEGSRIRKVSGGTITTVAGTEKSGYNGDNMPAIFAELSEPADVTVDSGGDLYIAERSGQRVRKVSGGIITTVAGTGTAGYNGDNIGAASAQVNSPQGVALDGSGNLYIADGENFRVRKVSHGTVTTIAGNGVSGFSGDGGLAADAMLGHPTGVAVDGNGHVFVADGLNNRVREIQANGQGATSTLLGVGPNPSVYGQNVTMTAAVTPSSATGSVAFMDGSAPVGMANLNNNGVATLTLSTFMAGFHVLTAVYAGDNNNSGSTSANATLAVEQTGSSTTLVSTITSSYFTQNLTFTATVMPLTVTGTVTFNDAGTTLGTSAVTNGVATLSTSTLTLGLHPVTAVYSGDNNYIGSSSLAYNQTVAMNARVGVVRNNVAVLEDSNGNGAYDPGVDRFIPNFTGPGGFVAGDIPVSGDWTGDGHAKVGIYRASTGQWFLDANNNGILDSGDLTYAFGGVVGDKPVVGDWLGVGKSCVGIFRLGFFWVLDLNCNGAFDGTPLDAAFPFGGVTGDVPVTGAWTGGSTKVGVVRAYSPGGVPQGNPFYWVLDSGLANAGNFPAYHQPDYGRLFAFGGLAGDVFVTGDWYGEGVSVAGVFRNGFWVLDAAAPGAPQAAHVPGLTFGYGGAPGDVPVVGKW
jgi:hypothetical protein